jgi:N-acetylglucosamine-6-phosphate deacetylase
MTSLAIRGRAVDVAIDGPRITSVGVPPHEPVDHVVDATGCSVLPGFVDLQVNGAVGVDLASQPERIDEVAAYLVQCGVTSFMPTVISSSPSDTARAIDVIGKWSDESHLAARSLGLHLEGPFLNPQRSGAHPKHQLRLPSLSEVQGWTSRTGVAMVTLAPELPNALDVIEHLVATGVIVCAGHTAADADAMRAGLDAGVRGVTHLFNAMGPISARVPGPAGVTLIDPVLIAGLIVDGIHVDPMMVRLAWRALGPSQIMLVTDAISALGLPYGRYSVGDTAVVVDETGARTTADVLAGSVLRFDEAVRNLIEFTGCTLADASISASATPARLARRDDIGRIAIGCLADIVLLDEANRVVMTVVDGRVVFDPQHRCIKQ